MESQCELDVILAATPNDRKEEIKTTYEEKGMIETVIYLVETVWDKEARKIAQDAINFKTRDTGSVYYKLLFETYNIKEHFSQVDSHRLFIQKAYDRLKEFVPNMTPHEAEVHDLSKYDFSQSVGYTARWVHKVDNDHQCWKKALDEHYKWEPHHPQFYKPNECMERKYLEESLIDMVASRWERQLEGKDDVTNFDLVNFNPVFLTRYVKDDYTKIQKLIEEIKKSSPDVTIKH